MFSPMGTPTPRRSNRKHTRLSAEPPSARYTGRSQQGSRAASRMSSVAPSRTTPFADRMSRATSMMDVDGGGTVYAERSLTQDTVFARSDELVVSFYAQLPVEVKQVLKAAGTSHVI